VFAAFALALAWLLMGSRDASAYAVLAHEAIVDAAWDTSSGSLSWTLSRESSRPIDYEPWTVRSTRGPARSAVYDLQDAFFMPLSGLSTVERPGPTIRIYRRTR
jgi:hypothetical protein